MSAEASTDPPLMLRCSIGPTCSAYTLVPWEALRSPRALSAQLDQAGWSTIKLEHESIPGDRRAAGTACPDCTARVLGANAAGASLVY